MATIAHFIDPRGFAGAERIIVELCTGLSQRGHRCVILHLSDPRLSATCADAGLACEELPRKEWYGKTLTAGLFAVQLAMELRRRKVDLLHSHFADSIGAGALGAVIAGIPHVASLHDGYGPGERPARLRTLRLAAASGTTLVTVSEAMGAYYSGLAPRMEFTRIPSGVCAEAFRVPADRPGPFTLLTTGPLIPVKQQEVLIAALAHVHAEVRLFIAGEGPLQADLASRARLLGVADRVTFLGQRRDTAGLLAEAHAFVLASRAEGLSCGLMEAMAAGLPAVVTAVGGNVELVEPGHTGWLVPPGDAVALAAAIERLAADRRRAAAMGSAARARAERLFPAQRMITGYDELYRSLLPLAS